MVEKTAPTVIKEVTVGAIYFGKKPLARALPTAHVAQACVNLFGADWQERFIEKEGAGV